jgi:uncharacterized protein (DUF849 family)
MNFRKSLRLLALPAVPLTAAAFAAAAVGAAAPGATAFLPGVYETTTTHADGTKDTARHCATSKGVQNDTLEKRLAAMSQDPSCQFTQRSIGGGKFAIAANCNNEGVKSSYRQSGTYTPTAMTMNMAMTMQVAAGQKPVSMNFTAVSRRVAATCPAGMTEE